MMSSTPRVIPPGTIVGAEARDDRVLDDQPGDRVGERAFEPVADLDAHLALARHDDQQRAVVLALLADLPVAAELVAEVLDRGALQRSQRDHDELVGGLGFERGELFGERGARRRIEDVGLVDDAAGQRREGERKGGKDEQQAEQCKYSRGRDACSTSPAGTRACPGSAIWCASRAGPTCVGGGRRAKRGGRGHACTEFATPSPPLPRKRGREQTECAERQAAQSSDPKPHDSVRISPSAAA